MEAGERASPRVSVIVATMNAAASLQTCIDSVAGQTYPHKEFIIVDGGSTDGTLDIIRDNEGVVSQWISEPDEGIYDAWNKGLAIASGDWIAFLGSDDYFWNTDVLSTMAPKLAAAPPSCRFVYADAILLDEGGQLVGKIALPWSKEERRFRQGVMRIPHPGMFHRRDLFEAHGVFDTQFKVAGDYELLLRELADHAALYVPGVTVTGILNTGQSRSFERRFEGMGEAWRARRMQNRGGVPWSWLWLACKSGVRFGLLKLMGPRITGLMVSGYRSVSRALHTRPYSNS
ncbi:MAG: glycosyltransferase [Gemmatimonadota bacterium]|nr:MAG: glycosyltransferase [Gemmatimonadota bacterium]